MICVERYSVERRQEWDDFVKTAKNGTFLFMRGYMDYHSDRFQDHSLLFYEDGKLLAMLPANVVRVSESSDFRDPETPDSRDFKSLISHGGLTYGGLIMGKDCTAARVCECFRELMAYLKKEGFKELIYKAVPHIYHRQPAEEDLYALTQMCHAELFQRSISSTIDFSELLPWRKGKKANAVAAIRDGVTIRESDDYAAFWPILTETLRRKYGAKPVHTLEEMELLHSRFPKNIRLLLAQKAELRDSRTSESREPETPEIRDSESPKTLGGAVLYITDTCIHAQYLCSSEEGDRLHCNEALMDYILKSAARLSVHSGPVAGFPALRYFDYGISTEDGGRYLNQGLISSKEGFGCRGIVCDVYKITL